MNLSVIVITKNAAGTIRRCLKSVRWADEIVVLDSGSSDDTPAIAREFTDKVEVSGDWPGFGPQKNRALQRADGDWVLSLDADEWVTAALRDEIRAAISRPDGAAAYRVPRLSSFCGHTMRHSGWWPDYVVRLFRRGAAKFSDDILHERVIVEGKTGTLREPIQHETVTDLDQLIDKMNVYTAMAARNLHERGRRASILTALIHGWWAFVRTYFLRAGFLDGRDGLMLAIANAEHSYYRYVKLMLLAERGRKRGNG